VNLGQNMKSNPCSAHNMSDVTVITRVKKVLTRDHGGGMKTLFFCS